MDLVSVANVLFGVVVVTTVFTISSAMKCSNTSFTVFNSCIDLPYLGAHLHWNYMPSHNKVSIAYRAKQHSGGWIAWAINPTGNGMIGSQALVAFHDANGSMTVYPTSIISYNPSMLPTQLSFQVSNMKAEYANNEMTIFATIGPLTTGTTVNHVWQSGHSVSRNIPQIHSTSPSNLQSTGEINFQAD